MSSQTLCRHLHGLSRAGLGSITRFRFNRQLLHSRRYNSQSAPVHASDAPLRRSYLYVPASSDRMLQKSLSNDSDMIIYDLEDSVPPTALDKSSARERLSKFLSRPDLPPRERVSVRVNGVTTPYFAEDISKILASGAVGGLVLPKVHSAEILDTVEMSIREASGTAGAPIRLVASIESALGMWNLRTIAPWKAGGGQRGSSLSALLFAAEDYCADTGILRSSSRTELLTTRSSIAIAAKAFGLEAIDMVCVQYKDLDYLKEECQDGRRLGFTGKQAIHPTQVDTIQSAFVPTPAEIERAAKIVHAMQREHSLNRGATGLEGEMIDQPMILQAERILRLARAASLHIPKVD